MSEQGRGGHAHLRAGWRWSDYAGVRGGWELDRGDVRGVVVRDGRRYVAYVVRQVDAATLYSQACATRAEAMEQVVRQSHVVACEAMADGRARPAGL